MADTQPHVLERLLQETDWLRRMARGLVQRDDLAEDAVQQTWLTALRSPPRDARSPRGWLAVVARRAVSRMSRSDRRRSARERQVSPGDGVAGTPDPAALAAKVEMHRRVAAAVLGLEEPYRSTVVMRYFEDRTPAEIAASIGIPAATVRTRLKRALETLRTRLDDEHDGDRKAWLAVLLPLADRDVPALSIGGLLMSTKFWLAAATLTFTAVIAWTWLPPLFSEPAAPKEPAVAVAAAPAPAPAREEPSEPPLPATDERSEEPVAAPVEDPPPPPAKPTEREATALRGRLVDGKGEPVVRGNVYVSVRGAQPLARAQSGDDGRFILVAPHHEGELDFVIDAAGFLPVVRTLGPLLDRFKSEVVFRLDPGLGIEGRVLDEVGNPVKTSVHATRQGAKRGPFNRYSREFPDRYKTLGFSDESGRFAIYGLAPGKYLVEKATLNYRDGEGSTPTCEAGARDVTIVIYRAVALALLIRHVGSESPVMDTVTWTLRHEDGEERSGGSSGGSPVVRGLRAGTWRITVTASHYHRFESSIELRIEESATSLTIPLVRTTEHGFGSVRGTVVRSGTGNREKTKYWIFSPELGGFTGKATAGEGRFEYPKLPVGVYHLRALSRDGEWATRHERVEVTRGVRTEVALRAERAGTVRLHVSGHRDCEERALTIQVLDEGGILAWHHRWKKGRDGFPFAKDGNSLMITAPGPVRVLAVARGRILGEASSTVAAGGTTEVSIALRPTADGAPDAPRITAPVPLPARERKRPEPPTAPKVECASPELAALIAKLADPEQAVRFDAVKKLGKLHRKECVAALHHVLRNDPDSSIRRMAIRSLGQLGRLALEAVPTIAQVLRGDMFFTRDSAAQAIVAITGKALPYRKGMTEKEVAALVTKHLAEIETVDGD